MSKGKCTAITLVSLGVLAAIYAIASREISAAFSVSTSDDTVIAVKDYFDIQVPSGWVSFIGIYTFIAVAYGYLFSTLGRVHEIRDKVKTLANHSGPEPSETLCVRIARSPMMTSTMLLGAVGNIWNTAFSTYGSCLKDIDGDSVPTARQVSAAAIIAFGAGGFTGFYNLLAMYQGQDSSVRRIKWGNNTASYVYSVLVIISLASWGITSYYGAQIAEEKAGFSLGLLWQQLLVNGLQAALVIINNLFAQLPGTQDKIAKRFQLSAQVHPKALEPILYEDEGCSRHIKSALHAISDILIFSGNFIQSAGNIGQIYKILTSYELDKSAAFYNAIAEGSIIAATNFTVYYTFRMQPARKEANRNIDIVVNKVAGCFSSCRKSEGDRTRGDSVSFDSLREPLIEVTTPSNISVFKAFASCANKSAVGRDSVLPL